jgi:hypothetical protein
VFYLEDMSQVHLQLLDFICLIKRSWNKSLNIIANMASSEIVTYKENRVRIKMNLSLELFSINICEQSGKAMKRVQGHCSFSFGRAWRAKYGISLRNAATDIFFANSSSVSLRRS